MTSKDEVLEIINKSEELKKELLELRRLV